MADIVTIDPKQKSVIPQVLLDAIGASASAQPPTSGDTPPFATDTPSGPPLPPELAAAMTNKPPALDVPKNEPMGPLAPDDKPANTIPSLITEHVLPQEKLPSAVDNSTTMQSLAAVPAAKPQVADAPSLMSKIKSHIPQILNTLGIVGGGLEGAFGPIGAEPQGAKMFIQSKEAAANRAIASRKTDIEQQQADTNEGYRKALQSQYDTVPVQVPDPQDPSKTITIQVQQKDAGKYAGTAATVAGKERTTGMQQSGAYQRELLKQGMPMHIDPELAQVAGQPNLANKDINGATLQNFIKTLAARGIHIQDLAQEGLWAVDKLGNRIKQLSVNSPAMARAVAGRQAGVVDVYDADGNLVPMTDAQRLAAGLPKAQTEFSEQGPTADMRNKGAIADRASQAGQRVLQDLQDPAIRNKIGVLIGRFGNLENVIGNMPPELAETAQDIKSFGQFVGGQHPVRGLNALEAFERAIGGIGQDPNTLAAKIAAQLKTSDFISNQAKFKPNRAAGGNGNGTQQNPIDKTTTVHFTEGADAWDIPPDKVVAFKAAHPNARSK